MSNKSPIFPIPETHHFSDYGFDPQIDYFRVLEEARKHKRETLRSIDSVHFKLQKPVSKDASSRKIKKSKKRWWRNALLFFRRKWTNHKDKPESQFHDGFHCGRSLRGSVSGPVYITESTSGSTALYRNRTTSRPSSGPVAVTVSPARKDEMQIPYISLRELNMDERHKISASPMPIYLVT